jgi:hypothetical protein
LKSLKILVAVAVALMALLGAVAVAHGDRGPIARASAVCADFPNQAAAQAAANTRDPDNDGIYCESLPCPCSAEWHAQHGGAPTDPTPAPPVPTPTPTPPTPTPTSPPAEPVPTPAPTQPTRDPKPDRGSAPTCTSAKNVVEVGISRTRYPAILQHMRVAIRAGWPKVMTLNRRGADQRRDRALRGWKTKRGMDRDEFPMAVGRKTWRTHVAYVPSGQNRGAGATIGIKLRRYCDGTRFAIVGY